MIILPRTYATVPKMQLQEEKNKPSINYSPNFTRYGSNAATACQG